MRLFKSAQIVAWILAAAVVLLSIVPPELRPQTGAPHNVEHLMAYAATGFAFGLGYGRRHDMLALLLVVLCGTVEVTQLFIPGRHARLGDFIVDAFAVSAGLLTGSLLHRISAHT
jgi:VanZ family protein